jgi:hypothetical protein
MLAWLTENIGTIVVSLILIAVVSLIVVRLIKDKKQGKSSCGCGCENCAMHGKCHK